MHWLKSGGGVEAGGGDRESWRASEAWTGAGLAAFFFAKRCLVETEGPS